jgi:hypothetical protein
MKPFHAFAPLTLGALGALALTAMSASTFSQIKKLTLTQMVTETDDAVVGQITNSHVFRVDHPVDGEELYFTTLTIVGKSLQDDTVMNVNVTYPGGFIDENEGVWNSEAPTADDAKIGNEVVAFYSWTNNMGGDVAGNSLHTMHGGLYRTVSGPSNTVVLGRGDGYAIKTNTEISDLTLAVQRIKKNLEKKGR